LIRADTIYIYIYI